MINNKNEAIVFDFSIAKEIGSFQNGFGRKKAYYMPREMQKSHFAQHSIDVYGICFMIAELFVENPQLLFNKNCQVNVKYIEKFMKNFIRLGNQNNFDKILSLIKRGLSANQLERPSTDEMLEEAKSANFYSVVHFNDFTTKISGEYYEIVEQNAKIKMENLKLKQELIALKETNEKIIANNKIGEKHLENVRDLIERLKTENESLN